MVSTSQVHILRQQERIGPKASRLLSFESQKFQGSCPYACAGVASVDIDRMGDFLLVVSNRKDFHIVRTQLPHYTRETVLPRIARIANDIHRVVGTARWYTRDAGMFFASGPEGKVSVWDAAAGTPVMVFENFHETAVPIRMHSPSRPQSAHVIVAVASQHPDVVLCDVRSGSKLLRLTHHQTPVRCVEWGFADHALFSAADDGAVVLWDIRRCTQPVWELVGAGRIADPGTALLATPSSELLVLSRDRLTMWDALTRRAVPVHFPRVRQASGALARRMALAGRCVLVPCGTAVSMLDVASGAERARLTGHYDTVVGVVANPTRPECYTYGPDKLMAWGAAARDTVPPPGAAEDEDEDWVT